MTAQEKEDFENKLRAHVFGNMRAETLRESSDKGMAIFDFEIKPHSDMVDRFHVPADLRDRYDASIDDHERVSLLNFYLYLTGREPRAASELGFETTATGPELIEGGDVGYGYALASQHQGHCADYLADAIELGKDNINNFYLKHVIHCLSLLKVYAPRLTMKEPYTTLSPMAQILVDSGYKQSGKFSSRTAEKNAESASR